MDDMFCRGTCTAALNCTELQKPFRQIVVAKDLSKGLPKALSAFPISHHVHARPA
jgi:hypothetical protein